MNDNPQKDLAKSKCEEFANRYPAGTFHPSPPKEMPDGQWRVVVEDLTKPQADDLCYLLSGLSVGHEK